MGSIENAAQILRLFGPGRLEVSVTDVSQLLNMPKSSASRLLKTMLVEGLLSRSENPPRYKVGNLLFEISRLYKLNSSLIDAVDEAVKEITRETGHTGYVSILDGADVLVIRMHQGSHALRVFTPLGQRAPAFATAIGRSLLSRFPDSVVRSLHAEGVTPPSPRAPQNVDELVAALDQPRRFGWAEALDEAIPGVGSISVSVSDPEIRETVGFCISYPASHMSDEERNRAIALLTAAAQRIAHRFGDQFLLQRAQRALGGGGGPVAA